MTCSIAHVTLVFEIYCCEWREKPKFLSGLWSAPRRYSNALCLPHGLHAYSNVQCTAIFFSQFAPSLLTLLRTSSVLASLAFVDKMSLSFLTVLYKDNSTQFRECYKGSGKSYSITMSLNDRCVCVCVCQ